MIIHPHYQRRCTICISAKGPYKYASDMNINVIGLPRYRCTVETKVVEKTCTRVRADLWTVMEALIVTLVLMLRKEDFVMALAGAMMALLMAGMCLAMVLVGTKGGICWVLMKFEYLAFAPTMTGLDP
jgi:hypothetical protein